ncbi:MAG: hypothetical protein IBX39_00400 [Candidatus Methanoperedenaceae archaeon]|nr:hypothetical protein [Candidatus Methanoperedenaceae archaeon]MDW7726445.1 hypothetical protein [Candidatus Methanoperedens sp.]
MAAVLYAATLFFPLAEQSYERVYEAKKDSNELWHEKLNTKIVIVDTKITGSELNITVYNNGSTALDSGKLDVVYNGTILQSFNVSKQGVWSPKTSINVTINNGESNRRLKIITSNGVSDYAIS